MKKQININELKLKNLNGYRPLHRNDFILVNLGILSIQAFFLFQFYLSIFDFDKRHRRYGTFEIDFISLAGFFRVKSGNSPRNWHKEIENCGLIKRLSLNIYSITKPDRYTPTGKMQGDAHNFSKNEKTQSIENILKSMGIKNQIIEETFQSIEKKDHNLVNKLSPIYNYPFKVGNGFFNDNSISNNSNNNYHDFESDIDPETVKDILESLNESTPIMPKNGS